MIHTISFPGLGMTFTLNRVAFTIPILYRPVYWYGVIIASGLLLAVYLCMRWAPRFGIVPDHIIDLMLEGLNRRLADQQLRVKLTDAAKDHIIDSAYDPIYGARPLRRYLQHTVETLISRKIIAGQVESGQTLVVDCQNGELTVDGREVLSGEVITLS
mgnify:FL=1